MPWTQYDLLPAHTIPFNLVLSVMERHHQMIYDDNRVIKLENLSSLLHDVFYAADKLSLIPKEPFQWQEDSATTPFDADSQSLLLTSFLATVFDP